MLDDGKVVECGKHEELLRQGGHYKKLYEMQFRDVLHITPGTGGARRWWNRLRPDDEPITESG